MKRGKKKVKKENKFIDKKIIITLIISLIVLCLLFFIFKTLFVTTKVIETPPTPKNCSNESIKKAWEFIFKGSSENITIKQYSFYSANTTNYSEEQSELWNLFFQKGCPQYYAYQINGTEFKAIMGTDMWFLMDIKSIIALNGEYTPEEIERIIKELESSENKYLENSTELSMKEFLNNKTVKRNINSTQQAKEEFETVFNISSSNWTKEENIEFEGANITAFVFNENKTLENITIFGESIDPMGTIEKAGMIMQNYSLNIYIYIDISFITSLKELEKYFGNWTSPINTSLQNITIEINNSKLKIAQELELFSESRSEVQKVEIKQNNETIIETEINFTKEDDFDWTKIILKKQDLNSTQGYTIINGLNYTKNITIDKLDSESKYVCIKDKEISSIEEISKECNGANEYLIECTGNTINNTTNFTCKISGSKFIVTGLMHSGVVEIIPTPEPCIQNWQCDEWSDYEKECGYRTCIDLNDCGNVTGKPAEYQECPICIPDWNCTKFLPEKCPKNETKTRVCVDINNCGKEEEIPSLSQKCERKNNWIWVIIIISLLIGFVLTIIIATTRKNKKQTSNNPNNSTPKSQPPETQYLPKYANNQQNNSDNSEYYYPPEY